MKWKNRTTTWRRKYKTWKKWRYLQNYANSSQGITSLNTKSFVKSFSTLKSSLSVCLFLCHCLCLSVCFCLSVSVSLSAPSSLSLSLPPSLSRSLLPRTPLSFFKTFLMTQFIKVLTKPNGPKFRFFLSLDWQPMTWPMIIKHLEKQNSMMIATRQMHQLSSLQLWLTTENTDVERVHEYRFLGVITDAKMKWQPHLTHLRAIVS